MSIQFDDYSSKVKDELKQQAIAFLEEASGELESQTKRNCARVTARTYGSFQHVVDEGNLEAHVGSDYENAIWEEFGTGIYAVNGDGRQGGWTYIDEQGEKHFTMGKRPKRMLFNAFQTLQGKIQQMAEERFGDL